MYSWIPILILAGCGALIAVQAATDVVLGRTLGLWFFAFAFTVVQLVATLPTLLTLGWPIRWEAVAQARWWEWIGGALGLPVLAGMAFALARTGTFAGLMALLVGQLGMGLAIDRFGWFAAPVHPITWRQLAGFGLVLLGVWLTKV